MLRLVCLQQALGDQVVYLYLLLVGLRATIPPDVLQGLLQKYHAVLESLHFAHHTAHQIEQFANFPDPPIDLAQSDALDTEVERQFISSPDLHQSTGNVDEAIDQQTSIPVNFHMADLVLVLYCRTEDVHVKQEALLEVCLYFLPVDVVDFLLLVHQHLQVGHSGHIQRTCE